MAQGAAVILPPDKKASAGVLGLLGSKTKPLHDSHSPPIKIIPAKKSQTDPGASGEIWA